MDKLYIIIPAYNEQDTLGEVIEEWYPIVERYHGEGQSRLVIIDDGSKDKTLEIAKEYEKKYPQLIALTKPNSGHGATVLFGYHYALEQQADYVFQTDSDGQTRPEEFAPFWENRTEYDMVIGWRNSRQDGWGRRMVTKVLKMVIKLSFHVDVTDANTPYRIMRTDTLKECIDLVPKDFNLSNVLLSVIYAKKYTIKYIPITFRPRQGGVNSINLKRIISIGWKATKDFRKINKCIQ